MPIGPQLPPPVDSSIFTKAPPGYVDRMWDFLLAPPIPRRKPPPKSRRH